MRICVLYVHEDPIFQGLSPIVLIDFFVVVNMMLILFYNCLCACKHDVNGLLNKC